jgi:hypothetical protein
VDAQGDRRSAQFRCFGRFSAIPVHKLNFRPENASRAQNHLRHSKFVALRDDKAAKDVKREQPVG